MVAVDSGDNPKYLEGSRGSARTCGIRKAMQCMWLAFCERSCNLWMTLDTIPKYNSLTVHTPKVQVSETLLW
jgi:hypothetical protein